mmetsp:Transcript_112910/g.358698  ORF Transcript_112910/g.358698 Transcript_112910/m.358698 type:complete len:250 (+) Transcript_112910:1361-2110(+)
MDAVRCGANTLQELRAHHADSTTAAAAASAVGAGGGGAVAWDDTACAGAGRLSTLRSAHLTSGSVHMRPTAVLHGARLDPLGGLLQPGSAASGGCGIGLLRGHKLIQGALSLPTCPGRVSCQRNQANRQRTGRGRRRHHQRWRRRRQPRLALDRDGGAATAGSRGSEDSGGRAAGEAAAAQLQLEQAGRRSAGLLSEAVICSSQHGSTQGAVGCQALHRGAITAEVAEAKGREIYTVQEAGLRWSAQTM